MPTPTPKLRAYPNLPDCWQKPMNKILVFQIREEIQGDPYQNKLIFDYLYKANYN